MALVDGESVKNDTGLVPGRVGPASFGLTTGMKARSRRPTGATGWTDHDSETTPGVPRGAGCL
jgi:hypothetical protein